MAGTKYLSGSPNLTVSINGSNEFAPGTTAGIGLIIQNTGLNQIKMIQSGIVDRDDLPSTAKMVTVSLEAGDGPILIKSDPQMIGDIKASDTEVGKFVIRVLDSAKAGVYSIPVKIDYTYLAGADQEGTDSLVYRYSKKSQVIQIPFIVKSAINVDVNEVIPQDINAGGEGFVTLKLVNNGSATGHKAVAKLIRSGASPVVPVDGTVYIGEFTPGMKADAKFKVSVSRDAEPQKYPLDVMVTYDNEDGETLDTPTESVGIPVGGKIDFTVVSEPTTVTPGGKKVIEVTYKNDGQATAYSAEARISAVDPFSSNDDLAYMGDVAPGQTAKAKYEISTSSDAVEKVYGLDSEIRYRDALDNSQISDTIKVQVAVKKSEGLGAMANNPILIAIIVVVILGGAYYIHSRRRTAAAV